MNHFTLGILFLLLSAICHAGWNFIAKKSPALSKEFFFIANTVGIILFLPILFFIHWHEIAFSKTILFCVALVGISEAFYFYFLAKTYSTGELSITYPIMRSFPVIFALIFGVFYHHHGITWHFSLACVITVIGCFILFMRHLKDFTLKKYSEKSAYFAYLTALCTTVYMVLDNQALTHLQLENTAMSFFIVTLFYSLIRYAAVSFFLGASIFHSKKYITQLKKTWRENKKSILFTTLGMKISYTLALLSMLLVHHVVYVILVRQLSVPIAALLGIYFAGEENRTTKWVGITIMAAGIVLASFSAAHI